MAGRREKGLKPTAPAEEDATTPLFYAYLALLVWLPLPLASARPWAWAVMEVWIYALAAAWILLYARRRAVWTPAFAQARPVLILSGLWLIYGMAQLLPLPAGLVGAVAPDVRALHAPLTALGAGPAGWLPLAIDPYAAGVAWLKGLAYVLVFALTLLLVDSRRRVRLLAYALIYSGLVQAAYGGYMTLSGLEYGFLHEKWTYRGFATGTFVNRNHLAGYLGLCLAAGIGLLIADLGGAAGPKNARQRLRGLIRLLFSPKARVRLYLAAMVIGLVLTRSRMGNTAFFAGMLVAGAAALVLVRRKTRATVVLLASLVIIDLVILGAWFGVDKVAERLEQTSIAGEDRFDVTRYGLALWRDHALTGVGAGGFYAAFPRYRGPEVVGVYHHAHNDYVQFLVEYGTVGAALLGAMVLLSLGAALAALRRRHDPLMRGMAFAATMGVVAMLIHATVEFNLQIPAYAATFMAILALAWIARGLSSAD